MDLKKDTWDVINSYFRDTDNYMVKHHIDSYNNFIINKIPEIFQNFGHLFVPRDDYEYDKNGKVYECNIYFGGKNYDKIYLSKPVIYDGINHRMKQLFPNEARLKNITYACNIFCDIDVEFTMKVKGKPIWENVPIVNNSFLKKVNLGKIPIMLHSKLCCLDKMVPETLTQMGESRYDPGGYFIVEGREKVIICNERRAENQVLILKSGIEKSLNILS